MDKNQLISIANLAKLKLEDSQINSMLIDFNNIVAYVDDIRNMDTSSIHDDDIYLNHQNAVRPDITGKCLQTEEIAAIAPQFENGYVVVPRVIET
jgi:aspartyl-tRNA(Asn)/glutamyl-tRNA(Gln) amidotransferase subunit C